MHQEALGHFSHNDIAIATRRLIACDVIQYGTWFGPNGSSFFDGQRNAQGGSLNNLASEVVYWPGRDAVLEVLHHIACAELGKRHHAQQLAKQLVFTVTAKMNVCPSAAVSQIVPTGDHPHDARAGLLDHAAQPVVGMINDFVSVQHQQDRLFLRSGINAIGQLMSQRFIRQYK